VRSEPESRARIQVSNWGAVIETDAVVAGGIHEHEHRCHDGDVGILPRASASTHIVGRRAELTVVSVFSLTSATNTHRMMSVALNARSQESLGIRRDLVIPIIAK